VQDSVLLPIGLAAVFLALLVVGATLATAAAGKTGVARALADINRVYVRQVTAARHGSLGDRAMRPVVGLLTALGRRLTPAPAQAWMRRWLGYAGNPPGWTPERVHEVQGLGLVGLGFLGFLVGLILWLRDVASVPVEIVLGGLIGAGLGFWLPYIVVSHLGQRRQQEIQKLLPDALDMLTLCVEAGLPFDQALVQVAHGTRGPLAREVGRALHEMQMGKGRAEAMRGLAERTSVTELRLIASAVVQATELGIPIADVLREHSREMRVRRRQRAEEMARKVPVKILFPLVFCLFPALFIVILGPGLLRLMDTLGR
jgi:tight adherence protein C